MTTPLAEKPHAVLGPSGWDWWSNCPGGPVLAEGRAKTTSVYAAWGTAAHEIAARCPTDNADAEAFVGEVFIVGAEQHRVEVDMEMADAVNEAINHVRTFIGEDDGLLIEQEVPIGFLTGETGATGTADVIGIVGHRLVVIDFKFGKGVQVWATDVVGTIDTPGINGQLGMYGLGALEKLGALYDEIEEIELVIVQPRLDHVDSVVVTVAQLREFAEEVTLAAGRVAIARHDYEDREGQWPELIPGEKQCKFCNAKAICPALKAEVEGAMASVSGAVDPDEFEDLSLPKKASSLIPAADIDNDKLAEAFRAIPLIEEWVKGIGTEMDRRLLDGQQVPGFYLGIGKAGRREWADPAAAEAELKRRYKVDEMYEKKVISPTKAEKLMKDKPRVWAKVVQTVGIVQPEGKPKVCREGVDKNKPYQLPSPADFDDLTAQTAEDKAVRARAMVETSKLLSGSSGLLDDLTEADAHGNLPDEPAYGSGMSAEAFAAHVEEITETMDDVSSALDD